MGDLSYADAPLDWTGASDRSDPVIKTNIATLTLTADFDDGSFIGTHGAIFLTARFQEPKSEVISAQQVLSGFSKGRLDQMLQ